MPTKCARSAVVAGSHLADLACCYQIHGKPPRASHPILDHSYYHPTRSVCQTTRPAPQEHSARVRAPVSPRLLISLPPLLVHGAVVKLKCTVAVRLRLGECLAASPPHGTRQPGHPRQHNHNHITAHLQANSWQLWLSLFCSISNCHSGTLSVPTTESKTHVLQWLLLLALLPHVPRF